MILSRIYNSLNKEQQEGLAFGLVFGLAFGLAIGPVFGLAIGLAFGLAIGLAIGLVFGLAIGLAFGLAFGLVVGLAIGLVFGLASPLWLIAIAILAISEILFFIGKEKPNKDDNKWFFTLRHKAEAIFEAALIVVNLANMVKLFQTYDVPAILASWMPAIETGLFCLGIAIETGLFYLGIGVVIIAGVAGWIWINSKKYDRKEKRKTGRPRKIA